MASTKLDQALIDSVCEHIANGTSNKDACYLKSISESGFYEWMSVAKKSEVKQPSKRTKREKLCLEFLESLKKAKILREQNRIQQLEASSHPTGIIFLLKNEDPGKWNKQPYLIPNFEKLEAYMQSEYTQSEIEAIRSAILAAEERRQSEIEYDENENFTEHKDNGTES